MARLSYSLVTCNHLFINNLLAPHVWSSWSLFALNFRLSVSSYLLLQIRISMKAIYLLFNPYNSCTESLSRPFNPVSLRSFLPLLFYFVIHYHMWTSMISGVNKFFYIFYFPDLFLLRRPSSVYIQVSGAYESPDLQIVIADRY